MLNNIAKPNKMVNKIAKPEKLLEPALFDNNKIFVDLNFWAFHVNQRLCNNYDVYTIV